jgi:Flp pilus assembly pilin Flp
MKTNLKMIAAKNSIKNLVKNEQGATAVEYALMLVAILILVAAAFKALGSKVSTQVGAAKGAI